MDLPLVIRRRLRELGLEQKDLAAAAQVTESYISQLLAGKKTPPAPGRTDIYQKMGEFLRVPAAELSKLAEVQRRENYKKRLAEPPKPLYWSCRELILRKCNLERQGEIGRIFENEPFGALERLITRKLLDIAKRVARREAQSENWLRLLARLSDRGYEEMRVLILEFLDIEVFNVSAEEWVWLLDPLIESWDIELETFDVEIVLNQRLTSGHRKRFEFVERETETVLPVHPGFDEFLKDRSLSGDATDEEVQFLKMLRFSERQPTSIYYYRELQNLRDPLHFRVSARSETAP